MVKGSVPMEMKKVSISAKRQITIPQKFYAMLGFDTEAECMVYVSRRTSNSGSGNMDFLAKS